MQVICLVLFCLSYVVVHCKYCNSDLKAAVQSGQLQKLLSTS